MAKNEGATERMIVTYYYSDATKNIVVKTNRSKYPRAAVMRAVDLMSMNYYGAMVAVVFDDEYGQDHAVITRHIDGRIETVFKRDPTIPVHAKFGKFIVLSSNQKKQKTKKARENHANQVH